MEKGSMETKETQTQKRSRSSIEAVQKEFSSIEVKKRQYCEELKKYGSCVEENFHLILKTEISRIEKKACEVWNRIEVKLSNVLDKFSDETNKISVYESLFEWEEEKNKILMKLSQLEKLLHDDSHEEKQEESRNKEEQEYHNSE